PVVGDLGADRVRDVDAVVVVGARDPAAVMDPVAADADAAGAGMRVVPPDEHAALGSVIVRDAVVLEDEVAGEDANPDRRATAGCVDPHPRQLGAEPGRAHLDRPAQDRWPSAGGSQGYVGLVHAERPEPVPPRPEAAHLARLEAPDELAGAGDGVVGGARRPVAAGRRGEAVAAAGARARSRRARRDE